MYLWFYYCVIWRSMSCLSRADQTRSRCPCSRSPPACYRIRPRRFLSLHTRSYISNPACYQIRPRRSPSLHTRELQGVKYLILVRKHRFLSKLPSFIGPRTPDTSKTFIFISNEHQVFYTSQVAELGHPCRKLKKLIYISCLGRKKKNLNCKTKILEIQFKGWYSTSEPKNNNYPQNCW